MPASRVGLCIGEVLPPHLTQRSLMSLDRQHAAGPVGGGNRFRFRCDFVKISPKKGAGMENRRPSNGTQAEEIAACPGGNKSPKIYAGEELKLP